MNIDEICPDFVGEALLKLSLIAGDPPPRTGEIVRLNVDYSATLSTGVVLPLVLSVTQPDGAKVRKYVYKRFAPSTVDFVPEASGVHLVRFGEAFHNLWFGYLEVDVAGDVDVGALSR